VLSLRVKLAFLFLIIGIIPVLVISLFYYQMARDNLEEEIYTRLSLFADLVDARLYSYFVERVSDGRVLAATGEIYQSLNDLENIVGGINSEEWKQKQETIDRMVRVASREYGYLQIYITDTDGIVVYDSRGLFNGFDYLEESHVRNALTGSPAWSGLSYYGYLESNAIILSTPIFNEGHWGTVTGTLNLSIPGEVINSAIHEAVNELGVTADAYLVDQHGLLMSDMIHGDYAENAALNIMIDTEAVTLLSTPIRENNQSYEVQAVYTNYHGDLVLGALEVSMIGYNPVGLVVEIAASEVFETVKWLQSVIIIMTFTAGTLVIIIGSFVAAGIAKPVRKVGVLADHFANGDFTQDLDLRRKDEVGKLAQSFSRAASSLRELIKHAVELSAAVNQGSASVSKAAEEISSSLQQLTSSTSSFSENARTLSEESHTMSEIGSKIVSGANEGNQAIKDAVNQMDIINNRVGELKTLIDEVNSSSTDIGRFLDSITAIADQTNLLALNAAIEAARAGEHGRGFAVVADEVRKLAEQSAIAANEIADLINATRDESKRAMVSMDNGVEEVSAGTKIVSTAGSAFLEILSDVNDLSKRVDNAASFAQNLSTGSEDMVAAIEEQSAVMEEMVSVAEELSSSAEALHEELIKFKYQ